MSSANSRLLIDHTYGQRRRPARKYPAASSRLALAKQESGGSRLPSDDVNRATSSRSLFCGPCVSRWSESGGRRAAGLFQRAARRRRQARAT
jgi:hypothetical protein